MEMRKQSESGREREKRAVNKESKRDKRGKQQSPLRLQPVNERITTQRRTSALCNSEPRVWGNHNDIIHRMAGKVEL